jgi:hypothetical protein
MHNPFSYFNPPEIRPRAQTMKSVVILALGAIVIATTVSLAQPAGLPVSIADYWSWIRLNINRYTDNPTGAHPQPKDVYINLNPADFLAGDGTTKLPFTDGTVVVKERNDPDELLVDRLYMMEKIDGAWNYSFFDRQSSSTFDGQELGTDNFCANCHQGAEQDDFVFTQFQTRTVRGIR